MIDLLFLGNGAMMPTPRRWLSSFLMRIDGRIVMFDVGEGSQIPWQQTGWGFKRLDTICLSHWHSDHIAGLPGVLHAVANSGRTEPLTIVGPKGTRTMVNYLRAVAAELPYPVVVADLANGQSWQIGSMRASVILGEHRIPVLLYRFDLARRREFLSTRAELDGVPREWWSQLAAGTDVVDGAQRIESERYLGPPRRGISIGVMTDTRPVEAASAHFRDVDLLIAEGTYGDSEDSVNALNHKHMTFAEAAQAAHDAGARRLVLTHFSPKMDDPAIWLSNARNVFAETALAEPGKTSTLTFD